MINDPSVSVSLTTICGFIQQSEGYINSHQKVKLDVHLECHSALFSIHKSTAPTAWLRGDPSISYEHKADTQIRNNDGE